MKVTLKLFSGLMEYLPPEADGNALEVSAPASAPPTAHALIDRCRLPREQAKVVLRNGEFLPPEERDRPLQDGDVIAVWPSIQGG